MIGKISGRLDWRGADHVLIDVRGVGYIVHVSDRTMAALPGLERLMVYGQHPAGQPVTEAPTRSARLAPSTECGPPSQREEIK